MGFGKRLGKKIKETVKSPKKLLKVLAPATALTVGIGKGAKTMFEGFNKMKYGDEAQVDEGGGSAEAPEMNVMRSGGEGVVNFRSKKVQQPGG